MSDTIAVIGGGAAGLMAAIAAGDQGASVVLYESGDEIGKTIRATGNGRCNLSNSDILASDYNHPGFVQDVFNSLPPEEVLYLFSDKGLLCYEEDAGRIYPYSNKAATVVDFLMMLARESAISLRPGVQVREVNPCGDAWRVCTEQGEEIFDSVIVAAGGAPAKGLIPADIPFKKTHPVLAALRTDTAPIEGLNGTRVRVRLYKDKDPEILRDAWMDIQEPHKHTDCAECEEFGEILFRDYGISGIAAFDMSRHVKPGDMVFIDFLPDMEPQDKVDFIYGQAMAYPSRTAEDVMSGMLPRDVARAVIKAAGLNPDEPILAEQEAVVLAMVSESFGLTVKGVEAKTSQVTRGGYAVDTVNPQTLECYSYPGLYIIGEMLDIDGRCGGYNLHWAWTTGIISGRSAAWR